MSSRRFSLTVVSHQIENEFTRSIGENTSVTEIGMTRGRFAPSPTGVLHVGNLRTALLAWLGAVSGTGEMLVRIEDLDRANSSLANERRQIDDLHRIGVSFPNDLVHQSDRFSIYDAVIDELTDRGLVYRCFCSRKEVRDAASAPHGPLPEGAYTGTCRRLTADQIDERIAAGRPFAIRLRTEGESYSFHDRIMGEVVGSVDDFVLRRNDGVPAYNLAVVVDDEAQGITQVVRGGDLTHSTPRHLHLQALLGYRHPEYAHVPLVLGGDGERLAKRHGAVTLDDLVVMGETDEAVTAVLLASLGLPPALDRALEAFEWRHVPRTPWTIPERWQTRTS